MIDSPFDSHGDRCAAWLFPAGGDAFAGPRGRPCAILAAGFGGTRDSGLVPYAERLAAAGLHALAFDYRGFGASGGTPRQVVSTAGQLDDYRAAIRHARALPGVDPERIVLWGVSYSGGHVVAVAAGDPRIAAAIAVTPAFDGRAVVLARLRHRGARSLLRQAAHAYRDTLGAALGREPHYLPIVAPTGAATAIPDSDAVPRVQGKAGPTWQNRIAARSLRELGRHRPGLRVPEVACPLLVQAGDRDPMAPAAPAVRLGRAGARAEVRRYPVDHYDVYGPPHVDELFADQLDFLARHVKADRPAAAPAPAV